MTRIFYVCHSLPNSFTGGSDIVALNMLKALKKKNSLTAISIGTNYCKKKELKKIHNELKKLNIKFYEIKVKNNFRKNDITIKNFYKKEYIEKNSVNRAQKFIKRIKFDKNDIILAFGSASIKSCKNINCIKIAIFEDLQEQVFYYRTLLSLDKFNILKKILKIIMIKIHFRGYLKWLKKISNNYHMFYTFSPFDYQILKKKIKIKILSLPIIKSVNEIKLKLKLKKKINISMLSSSISQDYEGVKLMYKYLIPRMQKEDLFNKIKVNLIMRIPKKIPNIINKIISDKRINIVKYNKKIIQDTDILFYPSKYPVGIRTKILFAFSKSWIVATSENTKKNIPYLIDQKNCLLSNNTHKLVSKIINVTKHKNKYYSLKKEGAKILKKYTFNKFSDQIYKDMKNL